MDSFSIIPVFVAVVESGSFSAAARALGITKSAVSKRVTQLEGHLGARLIHRTTRKLSLTEAGERYYEYAIKATSAAQNAEDAVGELQGEPQGLLKINAPMTFGLRHIAPLIPIFLARYPKVTIDLMLDDKALDLVEHGIDLAIRAGELSDSTLIARRLVPLRSVVCASTEYETKTALRSPSDLERENCILYSYSPNMDNWEFIQGKDKVRIKVKGNYRVNSSEALKEAILKGAGIGRLPSFVAGTYIREGTLVQLFSEYSMPAKTMYAVYPARDYLPAKVRAFLEFSVEYFGEDVPYWDAEL